jgi:hypothetical protein
MRDPRPQRRRVEPTIAQMHQNVVNRSLNALIGGPFAAGRCSAA